MLKFTQIVDSKSQAWPVLRAVLWVLQHSGPQFSGTTTWELGNISSSKHIKTTSDEPKFYQLHSRKYFFCMHFCNRQTGGQHLCIKRPSLLLAAA